jgi:hypothetical protein
MNNMDIEMTQEFIDSMKDKFGFKATELTRVLTEEIDRQILNSIMSLGDPYHIPKGKTIDDMIEYYDEQYEINKDSIIFFNHAIASLENSIKLRVKRIKNKHCE